ncbi:MAG: type 2 isopentenyl-diphosphate Delta-isomerase [Spirochaetaceae bacterium]|nr:MAG: type 2 isopentenyl-diphosphate Delta-isomerase [Spirochaetaceae bacterium]
MSGESIGARKAAHLDICTDAQLYDVEGSSTMLDELRFVHRSLPEVRSSDVSTATRVLDFDVSMPVFISCMTGGSDSGYRANRDLAEVAERARIPIGTGSIRVLFRHPEVTEHFALKKIAPSVPVIANIGGVQLRHSPPEPLIELLKRLEVDAVAVHLNPGQELVQPEGDRDYDGVLDGVRRLCDASPVPVIAKETGFGIAPDEARALVDAGVAYVDVAGAGGTNWVTVERYRLDESQAQTAAEFADWGTPTALLLDAIGGLDGRVLASGGLRTGMDVAKCIALGAQSAGLALPFARAVVAGGVDAGLELAERLRAVLTTVMILTGSRSVADLRGAPLLRSREFAWMRDELRWATGARSEGRA